MHLVCAAQIVRDLKVDIISRGQSYQGSTEQDTVVFSPMAIVNKIFNGST